MLLIQVDGGGNSLTDLSKKFHNTIIETTIKGKNATIFITELGDYLFGKMSWQQNSRALMMLDQCVLVNEKPLAGIYNIVASNGIVRPLKLSYTGARQWARGLCESNVVIEDIKGVGWHLTDLPLQNYLGFFEPQYPTFEEALHKLRNNECKHIALNSAITVMRGKQRLVFLRNFVPFLSCNKKLTFKIPTTSDLFIKDFEYYEHLYRSTL